tara:strand:- start:1141 stop:1440 length:300 start_codon:yes stop_codon:yes gene_type:complete
MMEKINMKTTYDELFLIDFALAGLLDIHMERVMELNDQDSQSLVRHNDPEDEYVYEEVHRSSNRNYLMEEENTVETLSTLYHKINRLRHKHQPKLTETK